MKDSSEYENWIYKDAFAHFEKRKTIADAEAAGEKIEIGTIYTSEKDK